MRAAELFFKLREKILSHNEFLSQENEYDDNDEFENAEQILKEQLFSTRLYIPLLISSLFLIVLFLLFNPQTLIKTINNPSMFTYTKLFKEHSKTLTCPCSTITLQYQSFVDINYAMHPLCHFVNNDWIQAFNYQDNHYLKSVDFRNTAAAQFQIINYLCSMSHDIIENEILISINQTNLISSNVLTENEVLTSVNATAERIRLNAPALLLRTLSLIRVTTKNDRLMSRLRTNYIMPTTLMFRTLPVTSLDDNDTLICSCDMETCNLITDTGFFDEMSDEYFMESIYFKPSMLQENLRVNGFYGSCTILDAVLMADFTCLYDEICLNLLVTYFPNLQQEMLFEASSMISNIKEKKIFSEMIEQLFIINWSISINHSQYFKECSPQSCSFTYNENTNILYAFTKILSLYGGLTIVLRFLTSKIIIIILRRNHRGISQQSQNNLLRIIRNGIKQIKLTLIKLNLFKTVDRNEIIINQQRWTTRFYLIILFSCLIISSIVFGSRKQLVNINVKSPSFEKYQLLLSTTNDLTCSCSQISSKYGQFISYSPRFHQICNSSFNKDFWFDWLYRNQLPYTYVMIDWREVSLNSFMILLKLCELSKSTLLDALDRFQQQIFVSNRLLNERNFLENFQSIINDFIHSTETNFGQTINLIRMLHHVNQPISEGRIITTSVMDNNQIVFHFDNLYNADENIQCHCIFDSQCQTVLPIWALIYNGQMSIPTVTFTVPGFVEGCYSTESLLLSNLQCLYSNNSKCLSDIIYYGSTEYSIEENVTIEPLNSSLSTRYSQTDLMSTIVYKLMIEEWSPNISYRNYFHICAPQYCNYRQIQSPRFIDIITILISLYGGFSIILRIILPHIIKFFFKNQVLDETNQSRILLTRIRNIISKTIELIRLNVINLNIFPLRSFGNIDRNHAKYLGRLSTRLFVILFIISLTILVSYTFSQDQTITKTIENPRMIDYQRFLVQSSYYHSIVDCSCLTTSILYKNFFDMKPKFHQICSSDFISNQWQKNFLGSIQYESYQIKDYHRFIVGHFILLTNLCDISIEHVNNLINSLLSSYFISNRLLTEDLFNSRLNLLFNQTLNISAEILIRQLRIIRLMIHGNQISSFHQTNYKYFESMSFSEYFLSEPMIYDDSCSCDFHINCISATLFNGLHIGCLPSESFLASTLACFYDIQCLQLLQNYLADTTNLNMTIKPLNSSMTSRYSLNETIVDDLFKELFIEKWELSINYTNYFYQCLPTRCTFTYLEQADLFYSITAAIALSNGLIVILKWWCPLLIRIFNKILRRYRKNSVEPQNLQNNQK